jgi:hypothetical protein
MLMRYTPPQPAEPGIAERREDRRHTSVLLIGKVRQPAGDSACLVNDISTHGLMARFTAAPTVDDRLLIELRGLPEVAATVRWVNGYKAGVEFAAPQAVERVFCLRDEQGLVARAPRFTIAASAMMRFGDERLAVEVLDISPGGVKLRSDGVLQPGRAGSILLAAVGSPIYGAICWTREDRCGFRFSSPLPLASLARVLGC